MTTPISPGDPLKGGCFCGAVTYAVSGPPILSAYCHCTNCQRLSACPFIATIHFPESSFSWTHPEPHSAQLDQYAISDRPWKTRFRCKTCGCNITSYNAKAQKYSVWGTQLEREEGGQIKRWDLVKPTAHIFYGTRVLDIGDTLTKWEGYEGQSAQVH